VKNRTTPRTIDDLYDADSVLCSVRFDLHPYTTNGTLKRRQVKLTADERAWALRILTAINSQVDELRELLSLPDKERMDKVARLANDVRAPQGERDAARAAILRLQART
jgi:hypothetical protein